jgi:nucleotide-binding universal stress UspA family protein
MEKVLVAVDGSDDGFRALDFSISLCEGLQAKLVAIYVIGASTSDPNYSITADMVAAFEDIGRDVLSKCEAKAALNGVVFEPLLISGDPAEEILKNAKSNNCDCIVVGKRGMGRAERLLMGSVSEKVSKLSELPVILVK